MYNAKSMKAEEFICHEEILDTLAYAEANKNQQGAAGADYCQSQAAQGLEPS